MSRGRLSLVNQVVLLTFLALGVIIALGGLGVYDRSKTNKVLDAQEKLLAFKRYLSRIEQHLLLARISEISLIRARDHDQFQKFQQRIQQAENLSIQLSTEISHYSFDSETFPDLITTALAKDLNEYRESVDGVVEVEIRIGLNTEQGLIGEIETIRNRVVRLIEPEKKDTLMLSFLNIQLSEQAFTKTLDMRISEQLVAETTRFKEQVEATTLNPTTKVALSESLENYQTLVNQLLESTLELELAIAESTLRFNRIQPVLRAGNDSLDESLQLVETALIQQQRISSLLTAALFIGSFLTVLLFSIIQIRNSQRLVSRLRQLAVDMESFALGRSLNQQNYSEDNDEISALFHKFLAMTAKINEQMLTIQAEQERAEIANNAKSVFLANMSHELRTPLNAILGFAQIMQQDTDVSAEYRHYLSIINESGKHLLSLINDVLEISKLETGKLTLKPAGFDLDQLLEMLKKLFQERTERKQLTLKIFRSPQVPQYIYADKAKLRQTIINLLENAIKLTDLGTVSLAIHLETLSARISSPASDVPISETPHPSLPSIPLSETDGTGYPYIAKLCFQVEDTGSGISAENLEQVFEAFAQSKPEQTFPADSNLGLAISRQFARLMGGDLTVVSTPNEGSIFTLTIEVACRTTSLDSRCDSPKSQAPIRRLSPGQAVPRILVAEDQTGNRLLIRKLLGSVGYEVVEAHNGQEAIERWHSCQPDLILMDIQMPVMDGLDATRAIRQLCQLKQPKIIALTASAFEEQRQAILEVGCDDFASKPINREPLLTAIGVQLGVTYVYENETPQATLPLDSLPQETHLSLSVMSSHWIQQLYKAAIRGDDRTVHDLIQQIPRERRELIESLTALTNNYRFDLLIEMVEPAEP